MTFGDLLEAYGKGGVDALAGFDAAAATAAGVKPSRVSAWRRLHDVYYGPTKWTAKQRVARELARSGRFSLDQLEYVEKRLLLIDDASERWSLRHQLLSVRGDYKTLQRAADRILPAKEPKPPRKALSFGRSRQGMRPFHGWAPERPVADLEFQLRQHLDSALPEAPQLMDAFLTLLASLAAGDVDTDPAAPAPAGQPAPSEPAAPAGRPAPSEPAAPAGRPAPSEPAAPAGRPAPAPAGRPAPSEPAAPAGRPAPAPLVPAAVPRPIVLVPLATHIHILSGHGDDTLLTLTDGTTMTGAEYLTLLFGSSGSGGSGANDDGRCGEVPPPICGIREAALFHPEEGAVNLYRASRFANDKQRDLAKLAMPACAFPGCRHGADNCEAHHIKAWKHGGETNLANLAPLCRYHNRVNDDDPHIHNRGRIEMVRGTPTWIAPSGRAAPRSDRPPGAMQLLFDA